MRYGLPMKQGRLQFGIYSNVGLGSVVHLRSAIFGDGNDSGKLMAYLVT